MDSGKAKLVGVRKDRTKGLARLAAIADSYTRDAGDH
ncbi:hypothetical protein SIAM614_18044 [Roseibium aggregatum IAM 12614]|uniref:Uncharacterized protein n=1 Tax=Roseibium aggregatum (strain ATCC 25650 / DSM 13394 / JCM 20685 / NBRC 16684 / NCIMB 2208 / IAM 12614 / B1) TaxID=384765 RepID=A0NP89_ROSAI|nr:hypothetical protein SIAM614_18044 [Roseibium aggregatum IAM 12614]